jgi:hypothetical protein
LVLGPAARWYQEDVGQIRHWGKVIKALHDRLPPDQAEGLIARLLADTKPNFSERQYGHFRHRLRDEIVTHITALPPAKQVEVLQEFVKVQPAKDNASRGALFSAYRRARLDATDPNRVTNIAEIPDVSKALPNRRFADGAIEVVGPLTDGPPKGRFLVDDKGGDDPFDPEQAGDYSSLIGSDGKIATKDGAAYDGVVYIFQSRTAAHDAVMFLDREGQALSRNIYVGYFREADGALDWERRAPPKSN